MKSEIKRQEDGTIILTITIPKESVKKAWEEVVESIAKTTTVPGFRKGKAPKNIVEEKADKEKVREEVLKQLLPKHYIEAVTQHNLRPIINPQIHVEKLADNEDWLFLATTCESPQAELGDYKKAIQDVTAKSKIILPGKEKQEPSLDDIIKALLASVTIDIPRILIEHEAQRLLAQTLDEVKRLGMSLDQYLSATKRSAEQLKEEYEQKATNDMKLEFALQKIAETEKITVAEQEIQEAIQKAKNEQERKNLQDNRYLLASILRQQKTLDFLKNL